MPRVGTPWLVFFAAAGVRYLRSLLDRFGNDPRLALAADNAGPAVVSRYGGLPP